MAYATIADIKGRMTRDLTEAEERVCITLLDDVAIVIDNYNASANAGVKKLVSCRAVMRMLGDGSDIGVPTGASEGSMSALGYSQSWKIGSGAAGEIYLSKLERNLLGGGDRVGMSASPVEYLVPEVQPCAGSQ